MVIILAVAFAVMILGNGILATSRDALYETYAGNVAADVSVAAAPEGSPFTIFGAETLLVGEYIVPPTLIRFNELQSYAADLPGVRETTPVVSALARVELAGRRRDQTLFGVDFRSYQRVFDDLEIVEGEFPDSGERGILVQESWGSELVGERAILTVGHDLTFTIREVPVVGIFRYPVEDDLLDRVAIVDAETARALNGYIYGAGGEVEIPEEERAYLEGDMDDFFGEADTFGETLEDAEEPKDAEEADNDRDGMDPTDLDELEAAISDRPEPDAQERMPGEGPEDEERGTVDGAWNFLLLSLENRDQAASVMRRLERADFGPDQGYQVRDWQGTVGGNAELVWYLQLMFNAGLVFVAVGAALITTNALVLSVIERTGEIGTMRALGASRPRVGAMISLETIMVVVGAAALGIALGAAGVWGLNATGVVVDNPYIEILFGGEPIAGNVTAELVAAHVGGALLLAIVSLIYPLKRALSIVPVEAMAE